MKIGKYYISEWTIPAWGPVDIWQRLCLIEANEGKELFHSFEIIVKKGFPLTIKENNKWIINIHNIKLSHIYSSMFPSDKYDYVFDTELEGKARVDLFLSKLQKLKVFL